MAYAATQLADEQANTTGMNPAGSDPDRGGAEFGEEGSGATSGYGDTPDDDLSDHLTDDEEDPLEVDADDALRGDELDDEDDV